MNADGSTRARIDECYLQVQRLTKIKNELTEINRKQKRINSSKKKKISAQTKYERFSV